MPEILEVETARIAIVPFLGARLRVVGESDPLVVAPGVDAVVDGARLIDLDRRGKQLVLITDRAPIGVHFGMTGRWLIDGRSPLGELAYGARSDHEVWNRWTLRARVGRSPATTIVLHDPRRLARVVIDPDIDRLGPDALTLTRRQLAAALAGRRAPVKAVLLDQHAVAGLGNLLTDEVLWCAGIDPHRLAAELPPDDVARLHSAIRRLVPVMMRRGGSHTGTLSPAVRASLPPCPRCGAPLRRGAVGGRTTVWCPVHQH